MFNKKEAIAILVSSVVIAFSLNFVLDGITAFLWSLLAVFAVIMVNVIAKKIFGFYMETDVEVEFWEVYQYGLKKSKHFRKPVPFGAFMPLLSKIILFPLKGFVWMASLVFEVKPRVERAARRHGLYSYSGMTEAHIGYIAAAGIFANLAFAVIGYLLGFSEFARINIFYALFNMIPISKLDGNKIFFGNVVLWSFLASLVLIGIFFVIFLI